ncbi:hypothetical protein ACHAW5_004369 [Stephanodiscus triporus]|uniref:Uncharacterized protein n=1 Tax=Stephanodiscus triporus TaxID=2934178 RepID=A0ABD3Q3D4_9STRA
MTFTAVSRAAARSLAPSMRRSAASALSRQQYSSSAVSLGGARPPMVPFARIPPESEKLVEQYDAIWDDGVAPEVTLDFDAQHIDSTTGLVMWLSGLGFFATVFQVVKLTNPGAKNPAVNRKMNIVGENPVELGGWKKLVE